MSEIEEKIHECVYCGKEYSCSNPEKCHHIKFYGYCSEKCMRNDHE